MVKIVRSSRCENIRVQKTENKVEGDQNQKVLFVMFFNQDLYALITIEGNFCSRLGYPPLFMGVLYCVEANNRIVTFPSKFQHPL